MSANNAWKESIVVTPPHFFVALDTCASDKPKVINHSQPIQV
jgi:hypothetical protein